MLFDRGDKKQEPIELADQVEIYNARIQELELQGLLESLESSIRELTELNIWDHQIAYVFALQKNEDLENFLDNLMSIADKSSVEFSNEVCEVLIANPEHAAPLLSSLNKLQTQRAVSEDVENLELLLKHPAEANLLAKAMIKLEQQERLNDATRSVLNTNPTDALNFARSGGIIPDDFKVDASDILTNRWDKLIKKEVVNAENEVLLKEVLDELKKFEILDRNMMFTIVAQRDDDIEDFLKNLLTVSRIGMPEDVRQALKSAKPQDARDLLETFQALCAVNPELYRHAAVRQALMEDKFILNKLNAWISILKEAKCWNDQVELASIAQLPHLDVLMNGVEWLQKYKILNEDTVLALLAKAPNADKLGQGLGLLSTDPNLYAESHFFIEDHSAEASRFAKVFLELKSKLPKLPATDACSHEVIQAIGEEVLKRCFHLSPSRLERISKNNSLIQAVGATFMNFANQSALKIAPDLLMNVAMAMADLNDIERIIHEEKRGRPLQETALEAENAPTEEDASVNWDILKPQADAFTRVFDETFNEANLMLKWHTIFSIIAAALNQVNSTKQDFLETEIYEPDKQIRGSKLIAWGNEVAQQLTPPQKELKKEMKTEISGPTLSQFLDTSSSDDKTLQSFGSYLQKMENIPFENFSLPLLYAINKILRDVNSQSFYGITGKSACIDAIRMQLTRKDPGQTFFKLSPAQIELFNSLWGEDKVTNEPSSPKKDK